MNDEFSEDDIAKIIEGATEKTLNSIQATKEESTKEEKANEDKFIKMVNQSTDDGLKKDQSEVLNNDIKKKFMKLKSIGKENFNMIEIAILCQKISSDYRRLAKMNGWTEIETMLKELDK